MAEDEVVAPAHERPDRRRRRVKYGEAMSVDHLPEPIRFRLIRCTLVKEYRGAIREQAIHDVTVSGHPADVGRAKIAITLLQIENVMRTQFRTEEISGAGVQH